jgi:outer membrane protein assembly factor BamD
MKILIKHLLFILIIFIIGCSSDKNIKVSSLEGDQMEIQMKNAYKEALDAYEKEDYLTAADKFNEAEMLFPQSEWAPKSSLNAAYSYYVDEYYNDSILQLEKFIKTYPGNERMSYAHYLLAMSHYGQIVDEKKDIEPLIESKKNFTFVVKNYPNTDFSIDAKFKLDLIEETLASKEMFIAKHYIKKEKWIPAINRLKFILKDYETTVYVEEAIHRLVEINYKIGLLDESKRYANLLGYNYASSEWYKKSYKILNKDYDDPYKKIKKKSTISKLRSILD